MPEIAAIRKLPGDLAGLIAESEQAGYRFLRRLRQDWINGRNQFSAPGEALFAAVENGITVGVCGLNAGPYREDPGVGRLRHLYVSEEWRGRGIGRLLVQTVISTARKQFTEPHLRTDIESAARFYELMGFQIERHGSTCTHRLRLTETSPAPLR